MSAEDYLERGNAYFAQGQYEKAILNYKKALELDSTFYMAWNRMGDAYSALGEYEQANECYKNSLRINPDQPLIKGHLEEAHQRYKLSDMEKRKDERLVAYEDDGSAPPPSPLHSMESLPIKDEKILDRSEVAPEKTIPMNAKAVYYPRMQQGKIYPLSVLVSSEKIRLLISDAQREKELELPAKIGDVIEIHPICPALSISPASRRIKVAEGVHEYQFTVVPLVEGKFDIHIEFYRDVELIGKISLDYFSYKKKKWLPGIIIQKKPKQINLGKIQIDISPKLTAFYSGIATVFGVATGALDQIGIDWQSELLKLLTQTFLGMIAAILAVIVVLGFLIGMKPFQIEKDAAQFKPIQYEKIEKK